MTHSSGGLLDDLLVLITSVPDLIAHVWMSVKARVGRGMSEHCACTHVGVEGEDQCRLPDGHESGVHDGQWYTWTDPLLMGNKKTRGKGG